MRYLLDTNIISNITKPVPSETLLAWVAEQPDEDLYIASLTVAEIRRGILEKPAGKRRSELDSWFSGPEGPQALFAGRMLSFDLDMIIAAVAEANDCVVVTDNEEDFTAIETLNPLRSRRERLLR
jgi:hypothetical protein